MNTERFSTLVRKPYLKAIRIIIKTIDYHNRMSLEDPANKEFHMKQSTRLREWMVEMKEFIKENE